MSAYLSLCSRLRKERGLLRFYSALPSICCNTVGSWNEYNNKAMMTEHLSHELSTEINPGITVEWPLNRRSGALGFGPSSATRMSLSFSK